MSTYNLSAINRFDELVQSPFTFDDVTVFNSKSNLVIYKSKYSSENGVSYGIIRYDKSLLLFSTDNNNNNGLCRSIVVNGENKVVGFSPPKSLYSNAFMNKTNMEDVEAQEFVEGTMINLFYDPLINEWEISTRNTVGGNSAFFHNVDVIKTFKEMFEEASQQCNLDVTKLNTSLCYSFVLQHPNNRIVVPVVIPQLYLIAVYKINNVPDKITVDIVDIGEIKQQWKELGITVMFPAIYHFDSVNDLIYEYHSNMPYTVMGVVLYNKKTGERTKIRNKLYEHVKNLRGNNPSLMHNFIRLKTDENRAEFLQFYPEFEKEFIMFRKLLRGFVYNLYAYYVDSYIKKNTPLRQYLLRYRPHIYAIHQIYLTELKDNHKHVTKQTVQEYVNQLSVTLLMSSLV